MMTDGKTVNKKAKTKARKKTTPRKKSTKALSPRSRKIYRQCMSCGGVVDQMYSTGDNSWCPHCFDYGSILEEIGELPNPQHYGSWLFEQKEAEEKKQKIAVEISQPKSLMEKPAPAASFFGGKQVKTRKKHTGVFSCPICCVEFELFLDAGLKCDDCGGPLVKGSLDDYYVDEDDAEY